MGTRLLCYPLPAFIPDKSVSREQFRIILKYLHLRLHLLHPPLMRLTPLPHCLLYQPILPVYPLVYPVQLSILHPLLLIAERCLNVLLALDFAGETVLCLNLADLLPAGSVGSVLRLEQKPMDGGLLLELLVDVAAALLVSIL